MILKGNNELIQKLKYILLLFYNKSSDIQNMLVPQSCLSKNLHKKQASDLSIPDERTACKKSKNKAHRHQDIDEETSKHKKHLSFENSGHKLTHGYRNYQDIKKAYITAKVINQNSHTQRGAYNFEPQICSKGGARTFNDFIITQEQFIRNKQDKIFKMKTEMNEIEKSQNTKTPKIDRKSRKISQNLNQAQVFSRLSREKIDYRQRYPEQEMFTPKILNRSKKLRRSENVGSLLYSDAQRRLSHKKMTEASAQMSAILIPSPTNANTNKLVFKKIKNQFNQMIEDQDSVSPIVAVSIISQIFHVDLNPNKDIETQNLCHKVLMYLFEDQKNEKSLTNQSQKSFSQVQISKNKMLFFIKAILNFEGEPKYENQPYSQQMKQEIYNTFGYFYRERLAKERNLKKISNQNETFYPKTLQSSIKLAETHRQKKLQQIAEFLENNQTNVVNVSQTLRIEDLFLLDSIRKQAQIQEKRRNNQEKQLIQCSFRPSLSRKNYIQSKPQYSTEKKSQNKTNSKTKNIAEITPIKQFQQKSLKQRQLNILRTQTDISQNRLHTEPFNYDSYQNDQQKIWNQPSIQKKPKGNNKQNTRKKIVIKQKEREIKDLSKNLLRMSVGRKIRQFQNNYKERGYMNSQNWIKSQQKMRKTIHEYDRKLKGFDSKDSKRQYSSRQKISTNIRY